LTHKRRWLNGWSWIVIDYNYEHNEELTKMANEVFGAHMNVLKTADKEEGDETQENCVRTR
jgi:hypothetical protein